MEKDRRRVPFRALAGDCRGATAVEYGLILSLIFMAIMGAVASLGSSVQGRWNNIAERVTSI
ncbi:Flp family type IVb pilin [Sphingomonas histidinilytica]|jgi:pilus assembly protein Flp/PilA|uniref:Pilus assembly protein Flp/PilA n=1 Tax=Rhizorhabdus histidinilytica TaxID=439228 RepID=A0A1T5F6Q9_9SPHN|nr:Flp family type IVb pilin [Rhizorhabdus histidinilytica]MBO9379543.1 Flp family type IVb pilin [Rhizorhabdus histidinilytica]QEH77964.1 Flp family type IVb pilin [Sphingomonas sp. C8-2]SKB91833.1 pilus assembly protein Flp/PilA [Rhizorhabdus histidinilytica]